MILWNLKNLAILYFVAEYKKNKIFFLIIILMDFYGEIHIDLCSSVPFGSENVFNFQEYLND